MLNPTARWKAFERDWRRRPTSYERNLRVYEALWREAHALGKLPPEDPARRPRRRHPPPPPPA